MTLQLQQQQQQQQQQQHKFLNWIIHQKIGLKIPANTKTWQYKEISIKNNKNHKSANIKIL